MVTDMVVDNDWCPPFSKEEFEQRYRTIREAMKKNGLDCLIVVGADRYINTLYLANYIGFGRVYVVFPLKDEPTFLSAFGVHLRNAREICVIKDMRWCPGFDLAKGIGDRLKELGLEKGNIGIVGPHNTWLKISMPVEHYNYLTNMFPKAKFSVVTEMFENARLIKSEEEIRHLEKAAAINDVAQEELCLATKPGVRHSDLYKVAASVAARCGGNLPFLHISSTSMSNPQFTYPDPYPTHQVVKEGDFLMSEHPMGYGGYYSKILATWFVGEPTKEYLKLFEVAASVHDTAYKELKPGGTGRDAVKVANLIRDAGYYTDITVLGGWSTYNHPPYVGLPEGMSKGAAIAEHPSMLDFVFKPGHVVRIAVHPHTLDGKRSLWVGSTGVFTKDGLRSFIKYPVNKLRVV